MNLESFFGESFAHKKEKEGGVLEVRNYTEDQIKLLEEIRVSSWLHTNVKSSVTQESIEHDKKLQEKMETIGLKDDDYIFFKKNHYLYENNNTLH